MHRYITLALLIGLTATPAEAMPLSPESVAELRASGRLAEVAAREAASVRLGWDAPGRNILPALRQLHRDDADETIVRMPVILIDFADNNANRNLHDADYYEELHFSEEEMQVGSAREWFQATSFGEIQLEGEIAGWFRAPQNYAYYVNGQNGMGDYPRNAVGMAVAAIRGVDQQVDFSDYDNDGDGAVEAVAIVHAGEGAEANGGDEDMIWSHAGWLRDLNLNIDGVSFDRYFMVPEDCKIGVICHEASHAFFGLPDLYDRDYSSEGVGLWSMMAAGSWGGNGSRPVLWDAWSRVRVGVSEPVVPGFNTEATIVPATTADDVYKLWTNGEPGREFFLVETRRETGFDLSLPSSGLLIYHIDERQNRAQNDNEWYPGHQNDGHYLVAVEQADGDWDLERGNNVGDSGDPWPGSADATDFFDGSTPNSRSYANAQTRVGVRNIALLQNGSVSCDLQVGRIANAPDISVTPGALDFGVLRANEPDELPLSVSNEGNQRLDISSTRLSGDDAGSFEIIEGGGAFNLEAGEEAILWIRFTPDEARQFHALLTIRSNDPDEDPREIELTGAGSGVPYITAPADAPDFRIDVTTADTIDVALRAVDPDGQELSWRMTNNGRLPQGVDIEDLGDGEARFFWIPGAQGAGPYAPIFTVADPDTQSDQIRFFIRVNIVNNPPVWRGIESPVVVQEDCGRQVILSLDTLFSDPEGGELTYRVENALGSLVAELDDQGRLSVRPEDNFNLPEGDEIRLVATDSGGASAEGRFTLIVAPVNDAPLLLGLDSPPDGATISSANPRFEWTEARDYEGDSLTYRLRINFVNDGFWQDCGADTFADSDILDSAFFADIPPGETIAIQWWVEVSDGDLATESETRSATLEADDVRGGDVAHPLEFGLMGLHPNPFNASTRIEFALPRETPVSVVLYALTGSAVRRLVGGVWQAGVHSVEWDGRNDAGADLPAGVYLIRIEAGGRSSVMKGALVR